MASLDGKKVAFLLTNGFEDSELTSPWDAVTEAGAQAVLVSPESGSLMPSSRRPHPVTMTRSSCPAVSPTVTSCG